MREHGLKRLGYVVLKGYILKSFIHFPYKGEILRQASLVVKIKTPEPYLEAGVEIC